MTIIVTSATWDRIRDHFSEDEKELLRGATVAQVICPQGAMIDEDLLVGPLRAKLKRWNIRGAGEPKR
jgi:hypothetical protein